MTIDWQGDDKHGYVGRVDGEELYHVDVVYLSSGQRVYWAGRLEKLYQPVDRTTLSFNITSEARACCEADHARQHPSVANNDNDDDEDTLFVVISDIDGCAHGPFHTREKTLECAKKVGGSVFLCVEQLDAVP